MSTKKIVAGGFLLVYLVAQTYAMVKPAEGGSSTADLVGLIAIILMIAVYFWPERKPKL